MKAKKNGDGTKSKARSEAEWMEYNYQSGTFDEEAHGRGASSSKSQGVHFYPCMAALRRPAPSTISK